MLHDRTRRSVLQILTDDCLGPGRLVSTQITDLIHLVQHPLSLFLVEAGLEGDIIISQAGRSCVVVKIIKFSHKKRPEELAESH